MLAVSGDQPEKGQSGAKSIGQVGKGRKRGTEARNGRKGVGTQGRHYVRLMMKENEGEEAVHAYSVTANVLYKGLENL